MKVRSVPTIHTGKHDETPSERVFNFALRLEGKAVTELELEHVRQYVREHLSPLRWHLDWDARKALDWLERI